MKFISIRGSSCSGKISVIKAVMKQREHLFHLSYDSLKWQFSRYSREEHYKDVQTLMFSVATAVCDMGYDIISETGLYKEWRETVFALVQARGYEIIEIELEADYDVLEKRFDERVAAKLANSEMKISNLSKERFREIYDISQNEKGDTAAVFRTDRQSSEEIAESILKLI